MHKQIVYQFDLLVRKVYLQIPFPSSVQVWWRRGKNKISTQNAIKIKGGQSYFEVNQKLQIQGNCHMKDGQFEKKQSIIQIVIFKHDQTSKLGGSYSFDMTSLINPNKLNSNFQQTFQRPLQNCPDPKSKIIFTLSAKYIRQSVNDSSGDVSFQANMYQPNSIDMTFRQSQQNQRFRPVAKTLKEENSRRQSDYYHQQTNNNRRQNSNNSRQSQKPKTFSNQQPKRGERPLQFSFNPQVDLQREKQNKVQMEIVSDLKQDLNQKNSEIQRLKQIIRRYEQAQKRNSISSSQKTLSLMNQLNTTTTKNEELKKEIKQLQRINKELKQQNDQINGQNKDSIQSYQKISRQLAQVQGKLSRKQNELNEQKNTRAALLKQIQVYEQENQKMKEEIFKKQSQYIALQNKYEKQINFVQEKNGEYQNIIQQMRTLKTKFQNVCQQNQHLTNLLNTAQQRLATNQERIRKSEQMRHKSEQIRSKMQNQQKIKQIQYQKQKETLKRNYQSLQQKFKEKQYLLQQIENQFSNFQNQTQKEKEDQIILLRDKTNMMSKKIQDSFKKQQSASNLISELKVKIKNLQQACENLQKQLYQKQDIQRRYEHSLGQKETLIEKAKAYIRQKQNELNQRDQFIKTAKQYLDSRQKQFLIQRKKYQDQIQILKKQKMQQNGSNLTELVNLKQKIIQMQSHIKRSQNYLVDYMDQISNKEDKIESLRSQIGGRDERIDQLENYLKQMQQRFRVTQEELQELSRTNRSLQQTLQQVVKKNLNMQIQLNIKNVQLQSFKSVR